MKPLIRVLTSLLAYPSTFALSGIISESTLSQASELEEVCPLGSPQPLSLVGGDGTEVEKTPENPPLTVPLPFPLPGLRIRDNFNTDWQIPGGTAYERFSVVVIPEESGNYDIEVSLKYGDETSDLIFNEANVELTASEPIVVNADPRDNLHPYQVNVRVGDEGIGNPYRATAIGCSGTQPPTLAPANTCIPLFIVGGRDDQSEVEKEISVPSVPGPFGLGLRNNWNTDWIVPLPSRFSYFVGVVESTDDEATTFDIGLALKYADDTADSAYSQSNVELDPEETVRIEATPDRDGLMPYQVNIYAGGAENNGSRYRASVLGCL
ncbi:MAG: hypothetical protein AAF766_06385 [Cyanobacteria bacterium P01_D01_bin.14]